MHKKEYFHFLDIQQCENEFEFQRSRACGSSGRGCRKMFSIAAVIIVC